MYTFSEKSVYKKIFLGYNLNINTFCKRLPTIFNFKADDLIHIENGYDFFQIVICFS